MNEIIIKYKRIKNIYIRVKPDLNIHGNITDEYIAKLINMD